MFRTLVARLALAGVGSVFAGGTVMASAGELETVSHMDLTRSIGKWYEVANHMHGSNDAHWSLRCRARRQRKPVGP